jgi:molybdenum cofactor biosynthesis protein A
MPAEGVPLKPRGEILTYEEIIRLARLFVGEGVTKIRLTGGEPMVRKDVVDLLSGLDELRSQGLQTLAMTTNGLLLANRVDEIRRLGIDQLNISLDTLKESRFRAITRRKGLDKVLRAIHGAEAAGYRPVKVNCVVMRGTNEDELADFVELTRNRPIEVRFIEYMPFDDNGWHGDRLVSFAEMLASIREHFDCEPVGSGPNNVAKIYRARGFQGQIGFITSMTDNFCSGCNRLRLTADGHLKVCLFGPAETSLRDAMRSGATDIELRDHIRAAVLRKHSRHAGMDAIAATKNRPMILIGG